MSNDYAEKLMNFTSRVVGSAIGSITGFYLYEQVVTKRNIHIKERFERCNKVKQSLTTGINNAKENQEFLNNIGCSDEKLLKFLENKLS